MIMINLRRKQGDYRPEILIRGGSSYPIEWEYGRFRKISLELFSCVTWFILVALLLLSPQCPKPKKENQSGGKVFALSGSETAADDRLIRGE
ncbi:hypothetical protein KIW84_035702 [Lathyrus oleraceus]|uniref:Uncharacterized protein n=1 Tax=Pisum sativum TaxID=3888 RepID=A0A9D5B711_PEA|nr:hypothetical protein KIW84_035702 [Pisum sativum]